MAFLAAPDAAVVRSQLPAPVVDKAAASGKAQSAEFDPDEDPGIQAILEAYPNHHVVICLAGCDRDPGVIVYSRLKPAAQQKRPKQQAQPGAPAAGEVAKSRQTAPESDQSGVAAGPQPSTGFEMGPTSKRKPDRDPGADTTRGTRPPAEPGEAIRPKMHVGEAAPGAAAPATASPPTPAQPEQARQQAASAAPRSESRAALPASAASGPPAVAGVAADETRARAPVVVDSRLVCVGDCAAGKAGALYLVQRFEWVTATARSQITASMAMRVSATPNVATQKPDEPAAQGGAAPAIPAIPAPAGRAPAAEEGKLQDRLPYDAIDVAGRFAGRMWLNASARTRLGTALTGLGDDGWQLRTIVMLEPMRR